MERVPLPKEERFNKYLGLPPDRMHMMIIIWNNNGSQHPDFEITVKKLVRLHNLQILTILETKVRANNILEVVNKMSFESRFNVSLGLWKYHATLNKRFMPHLRYLVETQILFIIYAILIFKEHKLH
ncbi:hypothetical protein EPI10_015718 [Gossypium australe]|uniref:Uncharacterized protein n=1 Tax=Gossypium australe TaxID=47621 RepID=A0A5B6VLN0_9ROSI|nr:hypothetical protein EPI10_015718 [Gossypium australe]